MNALSGFLAPLGAAMGVAPPQQQMAPQKPMSPVAQMTPRQEDSGLRRFLGNLGDAILTANGGEPIYRQAQERRQMGDMLAQYLGNGYENIAGIMRENPELGMQLFQMEREAKQAQNPQAQDPTALMQNIEYLRRLNPNMSEQQLADVAQYAIAAPRMYGSPEMGWSPDPNYPFPRQQQSPQGGVSEGATATNPETGERIIYRNGAWVPMGGTAGNGGGGFLGP